MPTFTGNYSGTLSHNFQDKEEVTSSMGSKQFCDHTYCNCKEPAHIKRLSPSTCIEFSEHPSKAVVQAGIIIMVEDVHKVCDEVIRKAIKVAKMVI